MKQELKKELEDAFAKTKKEFGLTKTFEEYENIFFLYDMAVQDGFVAESFHRQLSSRIVNIFNSWYNHLHSIILPSQGSMVSMTESNMFEDKEKEALTILMNKIIEHIAKNTIVTLTKDVEEQRAFLDDSVDFWNEIKPPLLGMAKQVHAGWNKYTKE